jgi:hypothetical protein
MAMQVEIADADQDLGIIELGIVWSGQINNGRDRSRREEMQDRVQMQAIAERYLT